VTGLVEFSPFGQLYTWGRFFRKISEVAQIFGLIAAMVRYVLFFKSALGQILGDSSGHPDYKNFDSQKRRFEKRRFEKRRFEKRRFEKRRFKKRRFEKRRFEKRRFEKRRLKKRRFEKRRFKKRLFTKHFSETFQTLNNR
jgi:hypothetical protein